MAIEQQPGNQTPNTPDFRESDLGRMKLDELRDKAREMGIPGVSNMHKDELVSAIEQAVKTSGGEQKRGGGGEQKPGGGGERAQSSSGQEQRGNQTPNTPDFRESDLGQMKLEELRDKAREMGIAGVSNMHKGELVSAIAQAAGGNGG
jgi:transcription termination factor Rho